MHERGDEEPPVNLAGLKLPGFTITSSFIYLIGITFSIQPGSLTGKRMFKNREEKCYCEEFLHASSQWRRGNRHQVLAVLQQCLVFPYDLCLVRFRGHFQRERTPRAPSAIHFKHTVFSSIQQVFWRNVLPETCLLITVALEVFWKERPDKGTELCLENLILILPAANRERLCFA